MSGEVPALEGDEAKRLTLEELGQGQEDHCWFHHGSPYTTSVYPKDTKRDDWFIDQATWRKEHKSEDEFEKTIQECEELECRDHIVILYKGLSNQRTTWSGRIRSGECRSCDNSLPGSWDSFIWGMYARRK